jgi:hypothetical protein
MKRIENVLVKKFLNYVKMMGLLECLRIWKVVLDSQGSLKESIGVSNLKDR